MDVIVIGAGYAGLTCAYTLTKNSYNVLLLEASPRPGGRAFDYKLKDSSYLEMGGQYICEGQKRIHRLLKEFGIKTYQTKTSGQHFFSFETHNLAFHSSLDPLFETLDSSGFLREEFTSAILQLEEMIKGFGPTSAWACENAIDWNTIPFQDWIDQRLHSSQAKQLFRFMINQGFSIEPEQISLLQILWLFKTNQGLPTWTLGGNQADRIEGGSQILAYRLSKALGERIQYNQAAKAITQNREGICVHTQDSLFKARAAVICIPPNRVKTLSLPPTLPQNLSQAFNAFEKGQTWKIQAIYKQPFWRKQGWSGNGITIQGISVLTNDNTPLNSSLGVLSGVLTAKTALEWGNKNKVERKKMILQAWSTIFGEAALDPVEYMEYNWTNDPFISCGQSSHTSSNSWHMAKEAFGTSRLPKCKRILWASSELAKEWSGCLEGAICAGEQAAQEVEEMLKHSCVLA
ncbi:FAD-dependent oxidoreductase [Parachlamydia sp. AcF125]|uniref:flavin monoamine oxidase family protein n=1 Tax=Parachlamydia sp. AcF125 TaxID=2795736 RepID=UPI001BC942BA|nr:FAD-dependent oxidoreductase [Parachlamydia sp. AcF125]MBS4168953.1 putative flavin-containing monoamine oxidase AofH [Parachlamydia sp. AcF125]